MEVLSMTNSSSKWVAGIVVTAMLTAQFGIGALPTQAASNPPSATETPIEHVIVLIGENRSFDHTFATYQPRNGQSIANLLAKGIIDRNGRPGPNFVQSRQFLVNTPLPSSYFISVPPGNKTPYAPFLPPPDLGGAPNHAISLAELIANPTGVQPPFDETISDAELAANEPSLEAADLDLLRTGATGAASTS